MQAPEFRQLSGRDQTVVMTIVLVSGVLIGILTNLNGGWDGILSTLFWISLSLVFHYLTIWFRAYPDLVTQYQQIRFGSTLGLAIIFGITSGVTFYVRGGTADFAVLTGLVFALYAVLYISTSAWLARRVSRSDRVQGS